MMTTKTRHAIVDTRRGIRTSLQTLQDYLPTNYTAYEVEPGLFEVSGTDAAGWTLDGYVIPRLASGLIPCCETEKKS